MTSPMIVDSSGKELTVRELRDRLRMTQAELAQELGVALFTIQRWEAGQKRLHTVNLRQLNRLAKRSRKA